MEASNAGVYFLSFFFFFLLYCNFFFPRLICWEGLIRLSRSFCSNVNLPPHFFKCLFYTWKKSISRRLVVANLLQSFFPFKIFFSINDYVLTCSLFSLILSNRSYRRKLCCPRNSCKSMKERRPRLIASR